MITIYMLTSPSGGRYIGQTKRLLARRVYQHGRAWLLGQRTALAYAVRKYGIKNFIVTVLTECVDLREAIAVERGLIAQYGTHKNAGGYNLTVGGEGQSGVSPSEETRAKQRAAKLGRKLTPEHRANISAANKGRKFNPHTPEQRARNAEAQKKYWANMPADDPRRNAAAKRMSGKRTSDSYAAAGEKVSATKRKQYETVPILREQAVRRMLHAKSLSNSSSAKEKRAETFRQRMRTDPVFREKMIAKQRKAALAHQRNVTYESALQRPYASWVPVGRVTYRIERHGEAV